MTASTISEERQSCFQFKASFAPCTILQLTRYDLEKFETQLTESIGRAPNFFIGSPVLIDLEKANEIANIDFVQLKQILINSGMAPMGIRGGTDSQKMAAATAGLPQVNVGKTTILKDDSKKKVEESSATTPAATVVSVTKVVSTPIRSGMQVYARGADLIVIGHVSPGAELLADGHIHVYGALRGRALAGVQGNTQARIFCHTLEAELVSIAGFYLTKEDMQVLPAKQERIQIYLEEEQVRIKGM